MSHKLEKLNELIKQVLGRILLETQDFTPGTLVTIMDVKTSEDYLHAKITISVFPAGKGEPVLAALTRRIFFIQQDLNKKLQMRPVPKIRFVLDKTEEEAQELEKLIKN